MTTPSGDPGPEPAQSPAAVPLAALLRAVNTAFATLVGAPAGVEVLVASVMLVDADDLADPELATAGYADLCLLAGVDEAAALAWCGALADLPADRRPRVLMAKAAAGSAAVRTAVERTGAALVAVHPQTRWESLLATVRGVLDSSLVRGRGAGADTDLFGLARTVATLSLGMVIIEDDRSQVLAYSASDDAADELRRLSILGRQGPADYLERLRRDGVYDRLRRSDQVVEVPADATLGLRRRLAVGIHHAAQPPGPAAVAYGTIWVQEGQQPLAGDSAAVLRGASAVAARLITRALNAPSNEAVQIQRLLGLRGGGVDIGSLAAALTLPTTGPAVVIGFVPTTPVPAAVLADLAGAVRLHASAYARESLVTVVEDRIYALVPRARSGPALVTWTRSVVERITARGPTALRAAVAAPVAGLADVPAARSEVDRVLDATPGDDPVATLADSRTPVLLGEIVDLVAGRSELRDPRVEALLDYDARHSSSLRSSLEAYLQHFGDVRRAAAELQVHPNTLRYRVRRAEQVLEVDLADPAGRLLVEIQLAARRRSDG